MEMAMEMEVVEINSKQYSAGIQRGGRGNQAVDRMGFDEADRSRRKQTQVMTAQGQPYDPAFPPSMERLTRRRSKLEGGCEATPASLSDSSRKSVTSLREFLHTSASSASAPAVKMSVAAAPVGLDRKPTIAQSDALLIKSNFLSQGAPGKAIPRKTLEQKQAAAAALARRKLMEMALKESPEQPAMVQKNPGTVMAERSEQFKGMKVRCKAADMVVAMQEHALHCAHQAIISSQKLQFKLIASLLKKEFDQAYGPAWHCIAGSSFGSYVTHSVGGFFYFSIGKVSILLFKTSVEVLDHK